MKRIFRGIFLFVLLLAAASCLPGQKQLGGDIILKREEKARQGKANVAFQPIVEFHGSAFPVQILSTATTKTALGSGPRMIDKGGYIGDTLGNFGAKINGLSPGDKIRLEVTGIRFVEKSALSRTIKTNKTVEVFPAIKYRYDELRKLRQPREENVRFTLFVNGKQVKEVVKPVDFRSLNEVPFLELSRHNKRDRVDHSYMFAAMVNEDAPFIDSIILKEAVQSGAIGSFSGGADNFFGGYQDANGDGDTKNEVLSQVFAVWYVLQSRKMRYSNITTTSNESNTVASQNVRSIEESFRNTQANCVDGSVLFASVLRKIGIDSFLVLIPGHMFIGFYAGDAKQNPYFLETTMLGNTDITVVEGKERLNKSRASFMAALDAGKDNLAKTDEDNITIVDIAQCRAAGIKPVHR